MGMEGRTVGAAENRTRSHALPGMTGWGRLERRGCGCLTVFAACDYSLEEPMTSGAGAQIRQTAMVVEGAKTSLASDLAKRDPLEPQG